MSSGPSYRAKRAIDEQQMQLSQSTEMDPRVPYPSRYGQLIEFCLSCQNKRPYEGDGQQPLAGTTASYCERCERVTEWKLYTRKKPSAGAVVGDPRAPVPSLRGTRAAGADNFDNTPLFVEATKRPSDSPRKGGEGDDEGINWKYTAIGCAIGLAAGAVAGFFIGKILFGTAAVTYTAVAASHSAAAASTATQAAGDAVGRQSTAQAMTAMSVAPPGQGPAAAVAVIGQSSMQTATGAATNALAGLPVPATGVAPAMTATMSPGVGAGSVAVGAVTGAVVCAGVGLAMDQTTATASRIEKRQEDRKKAKNGNKV